MDGIDPLTLNTLGMAWSSYLTFLADMEKAPREREWICWTGPSVPPHIPPATGGGLPVSEGEGEATIALLLRGRKSSLGYTGPGKGATPPGRRYPGPAPLPRNPLSLRRIFGFRHERSPSSSTQTPPRGLPRAIGRVGGRVLVHTGLRPPRHRDVSCSRGPAVVSRYRWSKAERD